MRDKGTIAAKLRGLLGRRFWPAILALFFLLAPGQMTGRTASLNTYVNKYLRLDISREQRLRISRYDHLIEYFCSFAYIKPRHKVNPDFIRALILAESNGNPRARSSKDARGLTQITYETGKMAARELLEKRLYFRYVSRKRLASLSANDLYDPAINILLACYLVAKYNILYDGKLDLVVSAWNAGEHSIRANRPAQYQETLNHIGKVNGYFIAFLKERRHRRTTFYGR